MYYQMNDERQSRLLLKLLYKDRLVGESVLLLQANGVIKSQETCSRLKLTWTALIDGTKKYSPPRLTM